MQTKDINLGLISKRLEQITKRVNIMLSIYSIPREERMAKD